ncbi:EAL domain-containing response regulator [Microcoleus vaginatus GB1-A2]|uniref:EAL domain-containing response regulator n=1 Tax=Microcoleus vaginatus TaxID=119532 RepID=UPI001686EEE9|nr:EAL domain-containing response regulator [Microcoleus sp. FACHB-61]
MLKILVIEDDELIRETLLQLLESQSYRVIAAENGRVGVQMALSEIPDLILCDVQMPELDGHDVLRTLRQNSLAATIPFIFLTAQSDKTDFRRGMELGADDYLTKPFTKAELLGAIASRLLKRQTITQPLTVALHQAETRLKDLVNDSTKVTTLSPEKFALEALLRHALAQGEFQVYYQPQVNIATGQVIGAEALVRWQNPDRGIISPCEFIPLAEETGLIIQIGEWVLLSACAQAASWLAAGFSPFTISVNLSARQLSDPELKARIVQILETTGLEPANLELEMTESALVENATVAGATLNELKALGIRIAIDDFGTGYATLGYLKQFAFDTLKIDRIFVRNANEDTQNAAITTAVILLGHSLNMTVIAEGVETEAELDFLKQHQCDIMQGYLFSRPEPAAVLESMLVADPHLLAQPPAAPARVVPFVPVSEPEKSKNLSMSGLGIV